MFRPTHLRTAIALLLLVAGSTAGADALGEHGAWDRLLAAHVRAGRVDYAAIAGRRPQLDAYLSHLENVKRASYERAPEEERLAFWINAYNAYTVALILEHRPLASIREIVPLWRRALGHSVFKMPFIPLRHLHPRPPTPSRLSLDDIEHGILRVRWRDPRIHFAIVCASSSCPVLRGEAYMGSRINEQLDSAARGFLGDPTRNRYNTATHTLEISSIFNWFRSDFERDGPPASYVADYLPEREAQELRRVGKPPTIRFLDYDWSLNDERAVEVK